MDKNNRNNIFYIRYALTVIGMLILVASVFVLVSITRSDTDEYELQEPSMVSHRVLFLCAYNSLYFTYDDQIEGLKEGLYPNGIDFDVVYMDSKNYDTESDKKVFHDYLKERLKKDRGYEAIILGDDDALSFALEYQDELFSGYPMVFFGINDASAAIEAAKNPMITGFYEKDYLRDCIEQAVATMPDRKKFVALHDDSAAGKADAEIFYSYDQKYPDYSFTDINTEQLTEEELIEKLKSLPEDSVLFYMTCYSGINGTTKSMQDRTATIVRYADVPIIRNYSGGRNEGVLGGTYMDFTVQCRDAAIIVYNVLEKKTDISEYPLDTDTPSKTVYNYRLMQKYNINEKLLPANAEIINRPFNFFEYYKDIIPTMLMIVGALILLIISDRLTLVQQRKDYEQLRRSRDEIRASQKKLRYQAEHDDLTGILNRRAIVDAMNKAVRSDQEYSVMMVDIDAFKEINENYGHSMSDYILKYLSDKLKEASDANRWLLGRYGGDEFIIMVPDESLDVDSRQTKLVLDVFRRPITAGEDTIILSASMGIANSEGTGYPEQHIINAEIAMYEAKEHGKNNAFVYADEMQIKVREENKLKARIIEAFEDDDFYMLYQPKVHTKTGKIIGFEALVRIRDFEQGPDVFVPLIEKNGWVIRLGRLITEMVLKQLSEWQKAGKELLPVSINFSSKQVNDIGYIDFLKELLFKYDIPARYLEIEITEGLLIEQSLQTKKLFDEFKHLGIRLLMDDFGTGYSSLGYLIYVPIDEIKLDKSLVDAYLVPGKDEFIGDVIKLVHDIKKDIIIEGVEEEWQFTKLREFEADAVQGFFFSKPLEPDAAIDFEVDKGVFL
ncbi:bifunctional diguanylate cyclase/phosphodiesterase [Butyrivibrio sp. YAB3001]|uniref:bifunctional diguanylate cyclase/phosphodiesterase n=1 Tax=Butyrivibrio sp. YAB3001 TaxID=1520812 RepID=UPI0008F62BEE|nr:bifunctional diguanylate cyclase/phosphodiesterase [Butyrivibrio sp. YAB3001]SFC80939.1 diguanylate cyclase (GGDEF) domain-containing protein [Butyrivibrio sp. YAB3001]